MARWRAWHTLAAEDHTLDFALAFAPPALRAPRQDDSVAYAYAEFASERRLAATLEITSPNACRAWLNGRLLLDQPRSHESGAPVLSEAEGIVKQGRNTLLIRLDKAPGPFWFRSEWTGPQGQKIPLSWWR